MTNTYNEQIDEALLEADEVYQLQQDEHWAIRDYSSAVWADGIVTGNEKKVSEIEQIYNDRLEAFKTKLEQWKENASKKHLSDIEFFKTHLHAYHMRVLDDEIARNVPEKKRSKTIKLPSRKLKCTKQQPEIFINGKEATKAKNDPLFIAYVKANNPEHINEEVAWGNYKKTLKQAEIDGKLVYIDDAGQQIDFIDLIERGEKYDWELLKEEL
jgi:inosine/xanthosine triphosphate pyrophosphatase family protein